MQHLGAARGPTLVLLANVASHVVCDDCYQLMSNRYALAHSLLPSKRVYKALKAFGPKLLYKATKSSIRPLRFLALKGFIRPLRAI